ncbi:1-deoxy-D-xylulose-5-phosphate synthase [Opitutae bacterium]|nr:1-deoxy-D-xylulose-5-phosphate synthase [Opitutae bacterium]
MSLLDSIKSPKDIQSLRESELPVLASEIREKIINTTSKNGGHVGPNLGVVELTIALHKTFSSPKDSFIFDVSHQGYVHKILTGRNDERFEKIRGTGGLSGFLNRSESEHDAFGAGHAGTSLSAALGMAKARDLNKGDEHIIAICGDASFTCGVTLEALNNVSNSTKKLIVILNDNKWSIAKNVGAMAKYFNELITNPIYNRLNDNLENILSQIPGGKKIVKWGAKWKRETKNLLISSSIFEKFGLRYIGPIDGHDFKQLNHYLEFAKNATQPVILHVITTKGKGYNVAIENPERFHGASPFNTETGKSLASKKPPIPKYQDVMGQTISKLAKKDSKIIGITAAMPSGTGLNILEQALPDQFIDVGIAEEHAAVFAAGMATKGYHPVCAIYSTFLQRAYDPIIHDIAIQNLPVLFCLDRSGLSPNDGATHHGLFDISYLRPIPNCLIMAPSDEDELADMIQTGLDYKGPAFIRYPRGEGMGVTVKETPESLAIGVSKRIKEGLEIDIWAIGTMLDIGNKLAAKLSEHNIHAGVVNPRFVKPLDSTAIAASAKTVKLIVSIEDNVIKGGFGSAICEFLQEENILCPIESIGWPDKFIDHASTVNDLRENEGLDLESILSRVLTAFQQADTESSKVKINQ